MRIKGEPNDTQWRTIFFTMSLTKALTIEKCFHAKYLNSRQTTTTKTVEQLNSVANFKMRIQSKEKYRQNKWAVVKCERKKQQTTQHCVLWHSSTPRTWIFISANEVQSNTHKLNYRMLHGSDAHWHIHSDTIINHVFKCNPIRLRKRSFDCFDLNFSFFGLICYVCR